VTASAYAGRIPRRGRALPVQAGAALVLPLAAVVGVGSASGGFFATGFGWAGLVFAWAVVIAAVLIGARCGWLDASWALSALALCVLTFASATWAGSAGTAVDQGLRMIVYAAAAVGALLLLRRRDVELWLFGLVAGTAAIGFYALGTRLLPDHLGGIRTGGGYRLYSPIGYWNALGIFATLGTLLALGVAVLGHSTVLRVLAAAALSILLPTLYYTYSRGSWAALAVGLVVALAYSAKQERLITGAIALLPVPALGVLLASRPAALTHSASSLAAASRAGHRVAAELAVLALVQACVGAAWALLSERIVVAPRVRLGLLAALAAAVALAVVGVVVHYGSPTTIARHAYDSFTASPTGGTNLNSRLFSFSNDGRTVLWRAALNEFDAHPIFGDGAGSFQRWWYAHRTTDYNVEDAHNLYVQTLGELGLVGGVLLAFFLGLPLVAAVRARWHPLAGPALGAHVAYLAHCIVDWDWQVPAVTLVALFAAATIVVAARGDDARSAQPLGGRARGAIGLLAAVAAVVAFVGLIGNLALAKAGGALLTGQKKVALAQAKKAHRWAPWSAAALRDLGEARILTGGKAAGLADLRRAAAEDPGDWQTWFDIATTTTGTEYQHALQRVEELNPQSPAAALLRSTPPKKKL